MALPFLRARPRVASGLERVICLDDPSNQLVTDNIGPSQMDKADVCDVRQNLLDVGEPATLDGKVSLGGITGDNKLRIKAQARQEHLHLLGRGVLGLVKQNEGVVQGAPPHIRKRRDLDGAALDVFVGSLHIGKIEQRIE